MSSMEVEANDLVQWIDMEPDALRHHSVHAGTETWGERTLSEIQHECTIHIKSPGKEELEVLIHQISDPKSPMYGKYLSKEEVDRISANPEGSQEIVKYLQSHGISIIKQTASIINAVGPIAAWETALNTHFFNVQSAILKGQIIYRAHQYYLPENIAKHVNMISNTIQLPVQLRHGPVVQRKSLEEK